MRTYKQQRREFVLLAMKLIENPKMPSLRLEIPKYGAQLTYDLTNGLIAEIHDLNHSEINEQQIQKLKDLLKEAK